MLGKKRVGMLECKPTEDGKLVCTFQELDKGADGAVFSVVAGVTTDGEVELLHFRSINRKPIDDESLEEAQRLIAKRIREVKAPPTHTVELEEE